MENSERTAPSDTITASALEKSQKEQDWKQFADRLGHTTDRLGKPIDSGIFDTVIALNLFTIHTTQSCEGHLDRAIAAPWVEIQVPETDELKTLKTRVDKLTTTIETLEHEERPDEELEPLYQQSQQLYGEIRRPQLEELRKVMHLLAEFYQNRQVTFDRRLTIRGNRMESQGAQFQEIISPEERTQKLHEYQQEMKTFTTFLKQKYFSGG